MHATAFLNKQVRKNGVKYTSSPLLLLYYRNNTIKVCVIHTAPHKVPSEINLLKVAIHVNMAYIVKKIHSKIQ